MDILKAVGAEVIVCPTNVEPDDPRSYYSVARRLQKKFQIHFMQINTTILLIV
jgi:cystathionine beta-synthase